jgi:Protein of unknown function (DUF3761)
VIARRFFSATVLASVLAFGVPALAQRPASAPKDSTAQCKDGTYSSAKTERGACSSHGGVKTWWGAEAPAPAPAAKAPSKKPATPTAKAAGARPTDATAQCKDGTYSTAKTKQGACSRHGGVATWFADEGAAAPATRPPAEKPAPPSTAKPKQTASAPENATAKSKDGTYSYAKQHSGACSHHGGVAEWYK